METQVNELRKDINNLQKKNYSEVQNRESLIYTLTMHSVDGYEFYRNSG